MWGVFTFYMWVGTLALNRAVQLVFLAAVDHLLPARRQAICSGCRRCTWPAATWGLLTAALAFYLAAAEVINETHGRAVLPIGRRSRSGRTRRGVAPSARLSVARLSVA